MARIRTVKPSFWQHEQLNALPEYVHMLAGALLNYADDEGYFNANVELVRANCLPLRKSEISIAEALDLLVSIDYVRLGSVADGRRFGQVVNFSTHQVVNRKTQSTIKRLSIAWDGSRSTHGVLTEGSHLEGKGKERKKESSQEVRPIEGTYVLPPIRLVDGGSR